MTVKLNIRNGMTERRDGVISMPWSAIVAASAGRLDVDTTSLRVTFDGRPMRWQLDDVSGTVSSRELVMWLEDVPGGDADYRTAVTPVVLIESGSSHSPAPRQGVTDTSNGVRLAGQALDVWISRLAEPWGNDQKWFANAATTVQISGREWLDANAGQFGWLNHDPEKRAMQLDRIHIARPPWDDYRPPFHTEVLHATDWTLVRFGTGPVRGWATFSSKIFPVTFRDMATETRHTYNCRVWRSIAMYGESNFLVDELSVRSEPPHANWHPALTFSARYFMSAHLGLVPDVGHYPHIPDWFGIGCDMPPYPAYGFATDAHVEQLSNPPFAFPRPRAEMHKAFSWRTGSAQKVRALHAFRFGARGAEIQKEIGDLWYEHLLKPLRAELAAQEMTRGA
jgi:hypothetical protein